MCGKNILLNCMSTMNLVVYEVDSHTTVFHLFILYDLSVLRVADMSPPGGQCLQQQVKAWSVTLWQLPESNKIKGRCCKYRKNTLRICIHFITYLTFKLLCLYMYYRAASTLIYTQGRF